MGKALIIGWAVSGKAAAAFLKKQGIECLAVDQKEEDGVLSDRAPINFDQIDLVVSSPGIPNDHPLLLQAREKKISILGEMELGLRAMSNRAFGITGSNGKTTAVLLAEHVLRKAGVAAKALGNVGEPLTEYLQKGDPKEILILELSSFQLETLAYPALEAAVVLNITPNHLDRHGSMEEYAKAKAQIQYCLKPNGKLWVLGQVSSDFPHLFPKNEDLEKELAPLSCLDYMQKDMPSKQSLQAAYLICKRCHVSDAHFFQALQDFKKPAHRMEWVAKIGGVDYYDDSKSSNIASVLHAVERLPGSLVLIVGGVHKGASYRPWIKGLEGKVRKMVAYGQAAEWMERELAGFFSFVRFDRFVDAVLFAKKEAKEGEKVLLSPGGSSFDQHANYKERGKQFQKLVREE